MRENNIKQNGFRTLSNEKITAVSGGTIVVTGGRTQQPSRPLRIPSNFGGGGGGTSFGPTISDGSASEGEEIVVTANAVDDGTAPWPLGGGPGPSIVDFYNAAKEFFSERDDTPIDHEIVVKGTLQQGQILPNGLFLQKWDDGVTTIYDPRLMTLTEVELTTASEASWVIVSEQTVEISADGQVVSASQSSTGSVTTYYKPVE